MANRSFLFAADSLTDMVCVDSDRVSEIEVTDATTVSINYGTNANGNGSIILGVTDGKADDVVKELGRIILQGVGVITIADDVNKVYGIDGVEEVDSIAHS
tara:strand:+ start:5411 stop:5713 length:303 start_codon:yes stop_codon:yes gene_type:complete